MPLDRDGVLRNEDLFWVHTLMPTLQIWSDSPRLLHRVGRQAAAGSTESKARQTNDQGNTLKMSSRGARMGLLDGRWHARRSLPSSRQGLS